IELIGNLAQWPKKHFGILNKCDNKTQCYGSPANYIQPAVPHHQTSCYSSSHFRNWKEYGVVPNGANPRFSVVGVYFLEAFVFSFFSGENLYYFHSRNTFLHKRIQICNLVPNVFKSNFHRFLKNARCVKNKRQNNKYN